MVIERIKSRNIAYLRIDKVHCCLKKNLNVVISMKEIYMS